MSTSLHAKNTDPKIINKVFELPVAAVVKLPLKP